MLQVISFGGKIAYYGLGKLEKMGSILVSDHLRLVTGHFKLCVPPVCRMARHYISYVNRFSFSLTSYSTSRPQTLWHTLLHFPWFDQDSTLFHKYCHFSSSLLLIISVMWIFLINLTHQMERFQNLLIFFCTYPSRKEPI